MRRGGNRKPCRHFILVNNLAATETENSIRISLLRKSSVTSASHDILLREPPRIKLRREKKHRSEIIWKPLRIARYGAQRSHPACAVGRGDFFGAYWNCCRAEKDRKSGSYRAARVPSSASRGQSCGRTIQCTGRFICALPDSYADSYCSGVDVHAAGAIAVQCNDSCPSFTLASLERPGFCCMWICDWNFGADHEFWDARNRWRQSSRRDHSVRIILFAGAVQGILAYPPTGNCAAPRVDDSRILNWTCGSYDPADYRDIFRHQPLVRADATRILRHRVLDWFCAASDCRRGLDSRNTTSPSTRTGARITVRNQKLRRHLANRKQHLFFVSGVEY
jgi:hypothetical protein